MHPGFISHWRRHHRGEDRADRVELGCGSGERGRFGSEWRGYRASRHDEPRASRHDSERAFRRDDENGEPGFGGGAFGVRRPLRFLAYKLELDEPQVTELARILDELKTERAQAAVDQRRTLSAFAEAIEGDAFDDVRAGAGADVRLQSAERLRTAVVTALGRLHKLLDPSQRARLAYLIRTGTLSI